MGLLRRLFSKRHRRPRLGAAYLVARNAFERQSPDAVWPFKADRVRLICYGNSDMGAWVVEAGGVQYALNGTAMAWAGRYGFRREINQILAEGGNAALGRWIGAAIAASR